MRHSNGPRVRREDYSTHVELVLVYPSPADTLTAAMLDELTEHVVALTETTLTSSIIIRSDRTDRFCSTLESAVSESLTRCVAAIDGSSVPVVAAVNGLCRSAGLRLVLACDVVIVAEGAEFAATSLECSETIAALLAQRIGRPSANAMLMAGVPLSGHRARHAGLAHHLCSSDEIDVCVMTTIDVLAEMMGQQRALTEGL